MSIAPFGGVPLAGRPGFPHGFQGGVADADPFTPGIQAQPGVITATGPSQVVGGGVGGGMLRSGFGQQGFAHGQAGFGGFGGGVVDADPFTPGIQAQPGVVTATGPSRVVQQGGFSSGYQQVGAIGGVVDADPFTPGIQAQPGVITATGPSQVVGGGVAGYQTGFQSGLRTGYDADPFTPGVQSQPGVITATGPSVVVGHNRQWWQCCPWWVWPLLCLLLLAALIGGLVAAFRSKRRVHDDDEEEEEENTKVRYECTGYMNTNGECVQCPEGFKWDGKTCTLANAATSTSTTTTTTVKSDDTAAPAAPAP